MTISDWTSAFQERAAIVEYEAGLPRREAEDRAWMMMIAAYGNPPLGVSLERLRR